MPLVLAYDIPDDKRRERLRKTLLRFGTPVQYSVFKCDLSPRQLQRMGVSSIVLALICLFCLGLAVILSGRMMAFK